jgi:hypothetical protein
VKQPNRDVAARLSHFTASYGLLSDRYATSVHIRARARPQVAAKEAERQTDSPRGAHVESPGAWWLRGAAVNWRNDQRMTHETSEYDALPPAELRALEGRMARVAIES